MVTSSDYQCKDCGKLFRVSIFGHDVKYAVCPTCNSDNVAPMTDEQEEKFEEYI